ncbi:hypothetical protein [uncultured Kushneria sp.]|uniref:hypothetical protein n=1 Tax=uncultured Kushneria sp. TaxID=905033 RepID=UPI0026089D88|nr:hypothetical protein [uncultured Kushneria sp.]
MLNEYLTSVYQDCGRGELVRGRPAYDCWALVREVRHRLYGLPLLPSFGGIHAMDKESLTEAHDRQRELMQECEPFPGAIAAVYRGRLCLHVAVVVEIEGDLAVLETRPGGPRWMRIPEFERQYTRVRYYRDRDLPIEPGRTPG